MKDYELRPLESKTEGDNGNRTLKVHRQQSSLFIVASAQRLGLASRVLEMDGAFLVTLDCTKAELEAVREEFNTRPKGR